MRSLSLLLVLLLALAVGACTSSSATSAAAGASSDPGSLASSLAGGSTVGPSAGAAATQGQLPATCSLLSTDEISGIIGRAVAAGVVDGAGSCKWERTDPHNISVGIRLMNLPGTLACQVGAKTPISGLADQAGWSYLTNLDTGSVVACRGRLQIQVTMIGDNVTHTTTEAGLRDNAIALTRLVLGRV